MRYQKLGNSGLLVSEICLGTMTFGLQTDEAEATRIVDYALSAGINFIDTADSYSDGRSEEMVGRAIKQNRHSVVLATKMGGWKSGPAVTDEGASRKHIMKDIEDSLRRLDTDFIDLYYLHKPDYNTPIEETLRAFDDLIRQGKVRYIACSNFRAFQLAKALCVSERKNLARFECVQSPYNLITRDIEYELLPLCAEDNVGVCVYNPLAAGLLTGKHDPTKPPPPGRFTVERLGPMYSNRYWAERNFEAVNRLKRIAGEHGHNLTHFSLAWILNNPNVTSIISGVSSREQLEDNLNATEIILSAEEISACDEVWQQLAPKQFLYGR